ncbi:MAG: hypothetical protein PHR28_00020 [candidate division Zixibacteria bacterium]|nr:hypothetical protein [candidate division Zixibacteria bacterium]
MLISVDGIDSVGKTTIANRIAKSLGGNALKCVPVALKTAEQYFMAQDSIDSKFLFYLSAYLSTVLDVTRSHDRPIIFDRYIYSNLAYHRAFGAKLDIRHIFEIAPVPDYAVYITCPKERWRHLLSAKPELDWYEAGLLADPGKVERIESEFSAMGLRQIINDNLETAICQIQADLGRLQER